jgi:hypothetical protein
MEELGVPPLLMTAAAIEEGQTAVEMAASQVALEPLVGAGPGGANVVMVPSEEDWAPPPPSGDHEVAMSSASEPSPAAEVPEPSPAMGAAEPSSAAGTVTIKEVIELATLQYIDYPGIGIVNLDAPELPSNDREMLEVATEQMFAESSILDTIVSVTLALCQYESAGVSAPPPHRRWRRRFLRSPRTTQSLPRLCPHHRRPGRARRRPFPS